MSSSSDVAARIARIDATFADEVLRREAYDVLAREDSSQAAARTVRSLLGGDCTTCVECCYPRATVSPPPTLPFRAPS